MNQTPAHHHSADSTQSVRIVGITDILYNNLRGFFKSRIFIFGGNIMTIYESPRPKGRPLTENERNLIAHLCKLGFNQTAIAKEVGVSVSTICRELKRGQVEQINGDTWEYYTIYSPQKAQARADYMRSSHGPDLKVGSNRAYLAALEKYIFAGSSPQDAIHRVGDAFGVIISKTTCYRYIDMRLFERLRYKHLPQGHPKTGKGSKPHSNIANPGRRSIERRSPAILEREEFGHWEIDSVIGKAEGAGESILVLTERKTRTEIILKPAGKSSGDTVTELRRLRRYLGRDWSVIFKTLTSDNGPEFADQAGLDTLGVTMFYCHPQSPHERGTNEVTNKLVRRKFPRGQSLAKVTKKQVQQVQHWVNGYCRPMFGGRTAADLLLETLCKMPLRNRAKVYRFFGLAA